MEIAGDDAGRVKNWRTVLLGMLPFGVQIVVTLMLVLPTAWQASASMWDLAFFAGYVLILIGAGAGMLAGFPRWVFPYLTISWLNTVLLSNARFPHLSLFGLPLSNDGYLGWRAFLLTGLVFALPFLVARSFERPVTQLVERVQHDWTLAFFALYGLVSFGMLFFLDGVNHADSLPFVLTASLVLIVGAFFYLRATSQNGRSLALLASSLLVMLLVSFGAELYWQTHTVDSLTGEHRLISGSASYFAIFAAAFKNSLFALMVLLWPLVFVGLLFRWGKE